MTALPFLRGEQEMVARRRGEAIPRACLAGEIAALADALPDRPHVVNFCTDRVRFAIGLAAAMLRGQVTLLPGAPTAAEVAALLDDFPGLYALVDRDPAESLGCDVFHPAEGGGGGLAVPCFPPDQVAAVLFTSGSTGRPVPAVRRWGRLVKASRAAGEALGVARFAGRALVATVPHAHSYGLESAVMLPLQHGLLLDAERPFFAADVGGALAGGGVLVTTPVHLRALVAEAPRAPAGLVLSATAPLGHDLAARAEALFNAPVFEIYGCSEAGQVATRRTVRGAAWRCLDGFRLRQDADGTRACGPDEPDVLLSDRIALRADGGFVLEGRSADQVNIAGKRSSLAWLAAQMLAIPGVVDAVFVAPDAERGEGTPRLGALAVAPGLDAAGILAALRRRVDAAFLPRPLRVVAALPRDALGKLRRDALLALLTPAMLRFPPDHRAAEGHFPGNPILPGAALLDALLPALGLDAGEGRLGSVKFHQPVRPGDSVAVTTQGRRFEARLAGGGAVAFSGTREPPCR